MSEGRKANILHNDEMRAERMKVQKLLKMLEWMLKYGLTPLGMADTYQRVCADCANIRKHNPATKRPAWKRWLVRALDL